jgi:hypothetical protein
MDIGLRRHIYEQARDLGILIAAMAFVIQTLIHLHLGVQDDQLQRIEEKLDKIEIHCK